MLKSWRLVRHYWQLSSAVLTAITALVIQAFGPIIVVQWLLGVVALALIIPLVSDIVEDLRTGHYGVNAVAPLAVLMAVVLRQYWVALALVIVVSGSEVLGEYAERRARRGLAITPGEAPLQAHVLRGRKVIDMDIAAIQPADRLVIKAGETMPVDAVILEGTANFDELWLYSEAQSMVKQVGDKVFSGSRNLDATITVRALRSASESQYQQLDRLTRHTSSHQAPFVRLAERYNIIFTLTVYIIAIAAWIIGGHAIRFLEVMVAATPYPLLVASLALVSGMSRAAKQGILIKNGAVLENLADTATVAFGKTGTLTRGEPVVAEIIAFKPHTKESILQLAGSLEQSSTHPLAQAILQAASTKQLKLAKPKHLRELASFGVEATLAGKQVLVGNRALLERHGVSLPKNFKPSNDVQTAIFVAEAGVVIGVIAISDELRPEAKPTFDCLRQLGITKTLFLTSTASKAIVKQLAIDNIITTSQSADKLLVLEQVATRPVTFVGTGTSDTPLLTAADVGLVLGVHDLAAVSESANVFVLRNDFSSVAHGVAIARRSLKLARQTVLVGSGLSVFLMACFASGHFPPLAGLVLQALINLFVICNVLRAGSGKNDVIANVD